MPRDSPAGCDMTNSGNSDSLSPRSGSNNKKRRGVDAARQADARVRRLFNLEEDDHHVGALACIANAASFGLFAALSCCQSVQQGSAHTLSASAQSQHSPPGRHVLFRRTE